MKLVRGSLAAVAAVALAETGPAVAAVVMAAAAVAAVLAAVAAAAADPLGASRAGNRVFNSLKRRGGPVNPGRFLSFGIQEDQ